MYRPDINARAWATPQLEARLAVLEHAARLNPRSRAADRDKEPARIRKELETRPDSACYVRPTPRSSAQRCRGECEVAQGLPVCAGCVPREQPAK